MDKKLPPTAIAKRRNGKMKECNRTRRTSRLSVLKEKWFLQSSSCNVYLPTISNDDDGGTVTTMLGISIILVAPDDRCIFFQKRKSRQASLQQYPFKCCGTVDMTASKPTPATAVTTEKANTTLPILTDNI